MRAILLLSFFCGGLGCQNDLDCSLLGTCSSAQICLCDSGWTGNDCSLLDIVPSNRNSGYNRPGRNSWGGLPALGDDGLWHLFVAEMVENCSLSDWGTNSRISHATSATPEGPFMYVDTAIPAFAHNPTIRRALDGTWVLYYIGGWTPSAGVKNCSRGNDHLMAPKCMDTVVYDRQESTRIGGDYRFSVMTSNDTLEDCALSCCSDPVCRAFSFNSPQPVDENNCKKGDMCCVLKDYNSTASDRKDGCTSCTTGAVNNNGQWPGPNMNGCGPGKGENGGCGITIAHSKSPSGPWESTPLVIQNQRESPLLDCAQSNPSPLFLKNGSVLMTFNAGYCHAGDETLGMAFAESWKGPYTLLTPSPIFPLGPNAAGIDTGVFCEDPFLFESSRGYHIIFHAFYTSGQGGLAYSSDARTWTVVSGAQSVPPSPYNLSVTYTDGSQVQLHDVQRPQLLFVNGKASYLINGASVTGMWTSSFTLFRKLGA